MEGEWQLFALLSSSDRLAILAELEKGPSRASPLARLLSMRPQEMARQLARLEASGLVERRPDAAYRLTGLGTVVRAALPTFDFIARRSELLRSCDLSSLPEAFVLRLGQLAGGVVGEGLGPVLDLFEGILGEPGGEVRLMADQVLLRDLVTERVTAETGPAIRIVLPEELARQEGLTHIPPEFGGRIQLGLVPAVPAGLAQGGRYAGIAFAGPDGHVDFGRGLRGEDPAFVGWCTDLFDWFWSRARVIGRPSRADLATDRDRPSGSTRRRRDPT